jgi:hypothetical protein
MTRASLSTLLGGANKGSCNVDVGEQGEILLAPDGAPRAHKARPRRVVLRERRGGPQRGQRARWGERRGCSAISGASGIGVGRVHCTRAFGRGRTPASPRGRRRRRARARGHRVACWLTRRGYGRWRGHVVRVLGRWHVHTCDARTATVERHGGGTVLGRTQTNPR